MFNDDIMNHIVGYLKLCSYCNKYEINKCMQSCCICKKFYCSDCCKEHIERVYERSETMNPYCKICVK